MFAISRPSASNLKSFSRSLKQFLLTAGQDNFSNKLLYFMYAMSRTSEALKRGPFLFTSVLFCFQVTNTMIPQSNGMVQTVIDTVKSVQLKMKSKLPMMTGQ